MLQAGNESLSWQVIQAKRQSTATQNWKIHTENNKQNAASTAWRTKKLVPCLNLLEDHELDLLLVLASKRKTVHQ